MASFMIGELAAATGAKVNTIRFYEDIGLMPRPARTRSGRRIYGERDLERLRFIRRARKLGFQTAEIRSLLALSDAPGTNCAEITAIAVRHLEDLNDKLSQLLLLRDELDRIAGLCGGGTVSECGIIRSLNATGSSGRLIPTRGQRVLTKRDFLHPTVARPAALSSCSRGRLNL